MNPISFLLIALVVAAIGILVAVVMHRQPSRPEAAMKEFRREMEALAPRDRSRPAGAAPEGTADGPSGDAGEDVPPATEDED